MHKIIRPDGTQTSDLLARQLASRREATSATSRVSAEMAEQARLMLRDGGVLRAAETASRADRERLFREHGVSVIVPLDQTGEGEAPGAPENARRASDRVGLQIPPGGAFTHAPMRLPPHPLEERNWNARDAAYRGDDVLRLLVDYVTPTPPLAVVLATPGVEAWQMTSVRLSSRYAHAIRYLMLGYPRPTLDEVTAAVGALPETESGLEPQPVRIAPTAEPVQTAEEAAALAAAGVALAGGGPWTRDATADDLEAWTADWMRANSRLGSSQHDGEASQARFEAGNRLARALHAWLQADGTLPGHVLSRYAANDDAYRAATAEADAHLEAALRDVPELDLSATPWAERLRHYAAPELLRILVHLVPPASITADVPAGEDPGLFLAEAWLQRTAPLRSVRIERLLNAFGLAYGDAHPAIRAWGMSLGEGELPAALPPWAELWCRLHIAPRLRAMPAWVADHWPEVADAAVPTYVNDFLLERLIGLHGVCRYYTRRAWLDDQLAARAAAFVDGEYTYAAYLGHAVVLTNQVLRLREETITSLAPACFAPGRAREYVVDHGCMQDARLVPDAAKDAAETGYAGVYLHPEVPLERRRVDDAAAEVIEAWLRAHAPEAAEAAARVIAEVGEAPPAMPSPRLVVLQACLFVASQDARPEDLSELRAALAPRLQLETPAHAQRQYALESARQHALALGVASETGRPEADLEDVLVQRRSKRARGPGDSME